MSTTVPPEGPLPRRRSTPTAPRGTTAHEGAFFLEEFRGITIVVSLSVLDPDARFAVARTLRAFADGDTRFVLVAPGGEDVRLLLDAFAVVGVRALVVDSPAVWDSEALADLWVQTVDAGFVVVAAGADHDVAETAGFVAANLRASKVVFTDPGGGWGDPPKSFAELTLHADGLLRDLSARGSAPLLRAAQTALEGGAASVNLCRAVDLERELLTFDGAGTLLTLGGYVHVTPLRVDDLAAVEALVNRGVGDGVLKPRTRLEVARMASSGLGARVIRTGHLAGVVGLETARYAGTDVGEVSGLITVSEFSGAGAGGQLVDALVERARTLGLRALFAVTVSREAAVFFAGRGFVEVGQDRVPPAKWQDYDPERLGAARCFWRDLARV